MTTANDLEIYYSGATTQEQIQDDSSKSLGGYRSSILVSNASLNNLFDELGLYDLNIGLSTYRCIFIKNNNDTDSMSNLSLYITGKKDFESIKFGVSIPANNVSAVQYLQNQYSRPYNVVFYEAYVEDDKITLINNFPANSVIALWINREVEPNTIGSNLTDNLNFVFDWN